jgi:hypothetical protein
MKPKSISELFNEHVEHLVAQAENGDIDARKSLACLALLGEGWRYGDPDPRDPEPPGGGEEIDDNVIPFFVAKAMRRAA